MPETTVLNKKRSLNIAVIGIKGIPARYGGFETCADETCRRLVDNGHSVTVYCRRGMSEEEPNNYAGIRLRYVTYLKSKNLATISATFFSCIKELFTNTDVIHLYTVGTGLFVPVFRLFGKKTVVSVDALDWARKKWSKFARLYMQLAAQLVVWWADELIIDSKTIQEYYRVRFRRAGEYVPFGANIEPYRGSEVLNKLGLTPRKYILFVGILRSDKQVEDLIRAFDSLQQSEYDLVILGDNPLEKDYVANLKILAGPRVHFPGKFYGEPYTQICQNAFMYVTPSGIEGTSPALLSAMGYGCCVLVNGIPENLETIGDAGFSYAKNDIQDLAKKLTELMSHPNLVEQYGKKAQQRVKCTYSWDQVANEFEQIYYRISG